jgi:hypothetical protein
MNESILIRLKRNGALLPIDRLTQDGVEIDAEADAWPRGLALRFDAENPGTKLRMDLVRRCRGWGSREYKLNLRVRDAALLITGVDKRALPAGQYWFQLQIGDLILPGRFSVDVMEGKETVVELPAKTDSRQIEQLFTPPGLDAQIQRVLSESRVDGSPLSDWIGSPSPRANRKACLLNLLAKLRSAPKSSEPLLSHVRSIFFADVDRCYGIVNGDLYSRLRALTALPDKPFAADRLPVAPVHRKLLRRIESMERDAAGFKLYNFRQTGNRSLQILIAVPPNGSSSRAHYADFDIDLGNPMNDLAGFFIHLGEILTPGKTDHLKLRQKLDQDPSVREFLYYQVVDEG